MNRKAMCTIACCFLGSALVLSGITVAQQRAGGAFPQPTPEKQVTVTEIPGVIAAGAQWKLVWQGPDNADGLVGTKDGGILFAQEQPSTVGRLDPKDKFSIFATDTHGTGALGIDYKGRVIGIERTCSDPGGHPDQCHEPAQLIVIEKGKKHETLASAYDGKTFWRMGELVCDSKGGVYFSDDNGTYFVNAAGKVSLVADKKVRTNGMTIDSEGRLYVTSGDPGIQVFNAEGKYLGIIPLPRSSSSVAFAGPGKKVLYAKAAGMKTKDGQEYRTPDGVRNNSKAIYKIDMIAQGFMGRPK